MSALPSRRYRILAIETRTLETYLDATTAGRAEEQAAEWWDADGEESFEVKECSFDVVFVEKVPE